jgi:hypothetical protein
MSEPRRFVSHDAQMRMAIERAMKTLEDIRPAYPDSDLIDDTLAELSDAIRRPETPRSGVLGELRRNGCAWEA